MRVKTCKISDLDAYGYLVNESSTRLSERFPKLQDKVDSATEKILEQIRKRRERAERKWKNQGLKSDQLKEKRRRKNFLLPSFY